MSGFIPYSNAYSVASNISVYNGSNLPLGWELDTSFDQTGPTPGTLSINGVFVYALKPAGTDDGQRILAFRGTDNIKNVFTDLSDIGKAQFRQDIAPVVDPWLAAELVAGHDISMVGHSLGGADVEWAINKTNEDAVKAIDGRITSSVFGNQISFTTFNAPGVTNIASNTARDNSTDVTGGQHYVLAGSVPYLQGDIIHMVGI